MTRKSFIARIPNSIADIILTISETRKWSIATTLTELVRTSPLYVEYSKENRVS